MSGRCFTVRGDCHVREPQSRRRALRAQRQRQSPRTTLRTRPPGSVTGEALRPHREGPRGETEVRSQPEGFVASVASPRLRDAVSRLARGGMNKLKIERPRSDFPELFVTVPDSWPSIVLAPLYDVHLGHDNHDAALFKKHVDWIRRTPNTLTWNGGDLIEN